MKRLIYLSTLLLGLLAMSCSKNADGIHASIVGIWNYSETAVYSDGNLIPFSDEDSYSDLDEVDIEFREGGTCIFTVRSLAIPLSASYVFDEKTGDLKINFGGLLGSGESIYFTVQQLTKLRMVIYSEEKTNEYYKDGLWLTDATKSHILKTEVTFKRQ